jgi:hypothetical protein
VWSKIDLLQRFLRAPGVRGRQALIRVTGRLEGSAKTSEAALSAVSRIVAASSSIDEEGEEMSFNAFVSSLRLVAEDERGGGGAGGIDGPAGGVAGRKAADRDAGAADRIACHEDGAGERHPEFRESASALGVPAESVNCPAASAIVTGPSNFRAAV